MAGELNGMRVAMLATNGVEQVELVKPKEALQQAGAQVTVVSLKTGSIQGMNHDEKGDMLQVDKAVAEVAPGEFDALMLPGGVANPDYLRVDQAAVAFVRGFAESGKPIAAICHGPWTLIEAGAVAGKRLTSWPSLRTDLRNAGADWVDEACVVDGTLVTSRKPDDIPAFNEHMVKTFAGQRSSKAA